MPEASAPGAATTFPSLFLSHGSPALILQDGPAHRYLRSLGSLIGRPKAILLISAHYDQPRPAVTSGKAPPTIYDFTGFPPALYEMTYPAPGDPALAEQVAELLAGEGITADLDPERGFDHGAWVPLALMFPEADIPVVQLSIDSRQGPGYHLALGKALAPLRAQGVLIIGSGSTTHNLRELFGAPLDHDREAPDWVKDFAQWMNQHIEAGALDDLLDYRSRAPNAERNHPTDEHLLPLYAAMGASGQASGKRIHASHTYGLLAMDIYQFGGDAAELAA